MKRQALFLVSLICSTTAANPTPKQDLMVPPDDATHYIIVSETNTHGDEWRWEADDGAIAFRKSQSLRGWITETDALVTLDADGDPQSIRIRGVTPAGDAAEVMDTGPEGVYWDSGADNGAARAAGHSSRDRAL
jgi:hypothetical protein